MDHAVLSPDFLPELVAELLKLDILGEIWNLKESCPVAHDGKASAWEDEGTGHASSQVCWQKVLLLLFQ